MILKVKLIFFLFILCQIEVEGRMKNENFGSLQNEIGRLKEEINDLKSRQVYQSEQINNQTGMLDTAFDGISAELSASSYFIGIFGIIIAIFSVGLSIYVARIESNVKTMRSDNETLLQKNIQIKEDLELLSEKITKDSKGLYKLVRNEESNHMIERLISVPEDIANLFSSLASRDLEKEHFHKIKEAFIQLDETSEYYLEYLKLIFQHFSDLAILDENIKPKFMKELGYLFSSAFKNDAVKSANDYFNAIIERTINKSITEVNAYIVELCKSKFAQNEEVYFAINTAMKNRELKFHLYDSISKGPDYLIFRKAMGKLILDYKYENLEPRESVIIEDINEIIKEMS